MLKCILVLLIVVGAFFAWKNWPSLSQEINHAMQQLPASITEQLPSGLGGGGMAVLKPDGTVANVSVPVSNESWSVQQVGGLQLNAPFELQLLSVANALPAKMPSGTVLEAYGGRSLHHQVIVTHLSLPIAGALPLWAFALTPNGPTATHFGLEVLPKKPATLLNGFRAQRTDAITKASPRIHYRLLLLERGKESWLLETHSQESTDDFEPAFQKMIFSVR